MASEVSLKTGVTIKASPVSKGKLIKCSKDIKPFNRLAYDPSGDQWCKPKPRDVEQMYAEYDSNAFKPVKEEVHAAAQNPLVKMCLVAFNEHRPIAITPDLLWHYIRHAVAIHINKYAEELRSLFVEHEGKMELNVRRDDFVKGGTNDWPWVFHAFRKQIVGNLKESAKPLICERFSTTTRTWYDISSITLMDAVQSYFEYSLRTCCGIPSVTLLGMLEDWQNLRNAAENVLNMFQEMPNGTDLEWWRTKLIPVLEMLVYCYQNPKDPSVQDWMAKIFKFNREFGSGAVDHVTGWVNTFFPYLGEKRINPLASCSSSNFVKNTVKDFSVGLSRAPFTWFYYDQEFKMDFLGGPCCITEQVTKKGLAAPRGSLHVQPGWAVAYQ